MLEDIITELTAADRVIIPFEHLRGARHVDTIIAEKGDALSLFIFTDDDMLVPGRSASSQLRTALSSGSRDQVVLLAPVSVEALVSWKRAAAAAVHHMVLSSESGERAELSREGAVYGYSMALVGELKTDKSSDYGRLSWLAPLPQADLWTARAKPPASGRAKGQEWGGLLTFEGGDSLRVITKDAG